MVSGNRMGPENKGPKTGRGLGYCSGSEDPGYKSDEPRQGLRRGLLDEEDSRRDSRRDLRRGLGIGFRNGLGLGIGFRIGQGLRRGRK